MPPLLAAALAPALRARHKKASQPPRPLHNHTTHTSPHARPPQTMTSTPPLLAEHPSFTFLRALHGCRELSAAVARYAGDSLYNVRRTLDAGGRPQQPGAGSEARGAGGPGAAPGRPPGPLRRSAAACHSIYTPWGATERPGRPRRALRRRPASPRRPT